MKQNSKNFYSGEVEKTVSIKASRDKIWKKISNIISLSWVVDVKKTVCLSNKRKGLGTIRKITFDDDSEVEERVVGWKKGKYLSYIAVSGLPLRAYHATISISPIDKNSAIVTWKSFFNTEKMSREEFFEFSKFLASFYAKSLANLKSSLEK